MKWERKAKNRFLKNEIIKHEKKVNAAVFELQAVWFNSFTTSDKLFTTQKENILKP